MIRGYSKKRLAASTRVYICQRMANSRDYGRVISARIKNDKAKALAKIAKAKSTKHSTVRASDLIRVAVDEFLARQGKAAA